MQPRDRRILPVRLDVSGKVDEPPEDGVTYGRKDQGWVQVSETSALQGTVQGALDNALDVIDLIMRGNGWRDNLAAIVGAPKGRGAPSLAAFGPTGNVKQMQMAIGDSVFVNWHINHDILVGSTSYFHAHWSTDGTQTHPVVWRFKALSAAGHDQDNYGTEVVTDITEDAGGTAWRAMVTEDPLGFITPEVDSLVIVEIERVTNGGTDNTDAVFLNFADIHYEADRYATTSRLPDFYT